ncbi:MAG: hypothetical protein HY238_02510 [Acidobacteria bacterium]|nr:hypothetical protein [Acidobacteriota bacterium]
MSSTDATALLCCGSVDEYPDLCSVLEEIGVRVLAAPNSADAVEWARLESIVLIVITLDNDSQWRTTIQTLQERAPDAPVIAYSRLPDERLWIDALEAGAYDFLSSPLYRRDLQWLLERAIQGRKNRVVPLPIRAEVHEPEQPGPRRLRYATHHV